MGLMDKTMDRAMDKLEERFGELKAMLGTLNQTQEAQLEILREIAAKIGPEPPL